MAASMTPAPELNYTPSQHALSVDMGHSSTLSGECIVEKALRDCLYPAGLVETP